MVGFNVDCEAEVKDFCLSDHYCQILRVRVENLDVRISEHVWIRDMSDENLRTFECFLENESWKEVYSESDSNVSCEIFLNILMYYYDISFPMKRIEVNRTKNANFPRNFWK